jgi:hypothetical protein
VDKKKETLWYRLWGHRSDKEKRRIRSFIPYALYTGAVLYGIIYLSILNSVNRHKAGITVKTWWGENQPDLAGLEKKQLQDIEDSFKASRKRVSGGF